MVSFFVTGIIGTCLYCMLLTGALCNFYRAYAFKKSMISTFFVVMASFSALEIPRYAIMAATNRYTSKTGFCLHLVAVGFFFTALSIICYSWMILLYVGKQGQRDLLTRKTFLFFAGTVLGAFILLSVCFCATASSLEAYFDSIYNTIYMVAEVIYFLLYSGAVVYFGSKISYKFRNYIRTGGNETDPFKGAYIKVVLLMLVISATATVRVTMLVLKMVHDAHNITVNSDTLSHHGLLWFIFTDFVPFCFGGATFQFIMILGSSSRKSRHHMDNINSALNENLVQSVIENQSAHFGNSTTPHQVADSDVDNTPQTPESLSCSDDEESYFALHRAHSFGGNSSVTTNSPYFGLHPDISPLTPSQRWASFGSTPLLPNSVSPAATHNFKKSLPQQRRNRKLGHDLSDSNTDDNAKNFMNSSTRSDLRNNEFDSVSFLSPEEFSNERSSSHE